MSGSKPTRDACGRFLKQKGPSQGQPKGPSQGQPKGPSQGHPEAGRAPSAASLSSLRAESSDSDESIMDTSAAENDRLQRKRAYLRAGSEGSSESVGKARKKPKSKKASTPSSTLSHDVGLVDAERQLGLARREQLQQDLEEKVAAREQQARAARSRAGYGTSTVLYADHSLTELERMALQDKEEVLEVASKSSNLKGTFQKALKCRAVSLHGIVLELVKRTATEETQQLQAKVDRLQAEVSQLHQKLAEATARPAQPAQAAPGPAEGGSSSPGNLVEIIRGVVMEERAFIRACFADIEDRLLPEKRLRPPLAADKSPPPTEPEPAPPASRASGSQPQAPKPSKGKGKGKGKRTKVAPQTPPTTSAEGASGSSATPAAPQNSQEEDALLPSTTPSNQSWTEVVRRGKGKGGKKSASAATAPAAQKAPAGGRKLVPPKTAAVVVTITPEAAERGETYESVLRRARANADPSRLGIGNISCRRTLAGARIFEFGGEQRGANADLFATKLQEVIADVAKVARPVRTASLEVIDMDDSVTKEDVVAAVAAAGGCSASAVRGGAIRPGRRGMGAIRVECPVAAAVAALKATKGRLLVGFGSAVVRPLEDKPARCFKCFAPGHTRSTCPSKSDWGESCFQCGQEGHRSATCSAATPHCPACAASGRPAGHRMGGRSCQPPARKGIVPAQVRPVAATAAVAAAVTTAQAAAAEEGGAMSE